MNVKGVLKMGDLLRPILRQTTQFATIDHVLGPPSQKLMSFGSGRTSYRDSSINHPSCTSSFSVVVSHNTVFRVAWPKELGLLASATVAAVASLLTAEVIW